VVDEVMGDICEDVTDKKHYELNAVGAHHFTWADSARGGGHSPGALGELQGKLAPLLTEHFETLSQSLGPLVEEHLRSCKQCGQLRVLQTVEESLQEQMDQVSLNYHGGV